MKKIPTLYKRIFDDDRNKVEILDEVIPGLEWVLNGEGIATVKVDGACCAIIHGDMYKRYDVKKGKCMPANAIKCQEEADPVTGHFPCWVKCYNEVPSDKWFLKAYSVYREYVPESLIQDGTYEAIGPHFNGNPYKLTSDQLVMHGIYIVDVPRTFDGIKQFLQDHPFEGIVFWKDGEPRCKIKRSDFGFEWPCENAKYSIFQP